MNRREHLLTVAIEECAEVQKELCKALRFGMDDHDPQDPECTPNHAKIVREVTDLMAALDMLEAEGAFPSLMDFDMDAAMEAKKAKVEKHLRYSGERGTYKFTPDPDRAALVEDLEKYATLLNRWGPTPGGDLVLLAARALAAPAEREPDEALDALAPKGEHRS